ncbi:MAG: DcrB-related protein [Clostridia bacterium]|nr:DcrB-related protein [Clostridia bacterium]
MKKLTKLSILAMMMLVAVMLLTGCANNVLTTDEKDSVSGLAVYTEEETPDYVTFDKIEGVEFKYPSNYKSIGKESLPMFMDPDVAGATINIVTSDFPSALTFEGYVDASIPGIKSQMDIEGDIKTEYINLNGKKAARLDYVATSRGQTMSITQILIKKDDKAYILTLGSLKADKDKVSEKYEKIIKSFK